MAALAVFSSCANSHPFDERRVALTDPQKIGRSVATARPTPTNAVFDCKVLSRNHALIWYEEGKFFLQDTKSSNGTFVNSQRLSKGSDESDPKEIFSGDTVQFGVDVMENSRKVTHSCIIAMINLYHPDGKEALSSHSTSSSANVGGMSSLQSQELYQLAQYLQDALHREQVLENKLATLQRLVQTTQEASDTGWQALVDEDRLLSRLEALENQLVVYSKLHSEESLKLELAALQDDKYNYEMTAKESLRKVLEEKLDAMRKISELEQGINHWEEECSHSLQRTETAEQQLQELAENHQETITQLEELTSKLTEAEKKQSELEGRHDREKNELETRINALLMEEEKLQAKMESLQADCDFKTEQLNNLKSQKDIDRKNSTNESPKIYEMTNQGIQVDLINLLDLKLLQGYGGEDDECSLSGSEDGECNGKYNENKISEKDSTESVRVAKVAPLKSEGNGNLSDLQKAYKRMDTVVQNSEVNNNELEQLRAELEQTTASLEKANKEINRYKEELTQLKSELSVKNKSSPQPVAITNENTDNEDARNQIVSLKEELEQALQDVKFSKTETEQLKARVRTLQEELELERLNVSTPTSSSEDDDKNKNKTADSVQLEIQRELAHNRAEFSVLKEECAQLRRRIQDIEQEMKMSRLENVQLKQQYEQLLESYKQLQQVKTELQSSESTYQMNLTDAQKETEQYRLELSKAKELIAELEKRCTSSEDLVTTLREQLKDAEDRLLSPGSPRGQFSLSSSPSRTDHSSSERETGDEELDEDYSLLAFRCRTVSTLSAIPLLMLIFAFIISFLPFLSTITATSPPPGTNPDSS